MLITLKIMITELHQRTRAASVTQRVTPRPELAGSGRDVVVQVRVSVCREGASAVVCEVPLYDLTLFLLTVYAGLFPEHLLTNQESEGERTATTSEKARLALQISQRPAGPPPPADNP